MWICGSIKRGVWNFLSRADKTGAIPICDKCLCRWIERRWFTHILCCVYSRLNWWECRQFNGILSSGEIISPDSSHSFPSQRESVILFSIFVRRLVRAKKWADGPEVGSWNATLFNSGNSVLRNKSFWNTQQPSVFSFVFPSTRFLLFFSIFGIFVCGRIKFQADGSRRRPLTAASSCLWILMSEFKWVDSR